LPNQLASGIEESDDPLIDSRSAVGSCGRDAERWTSLSAIAVNVAHDLTSLVGGLA
jgi:hypothetical protein